MTNMGYKKIKILNFTILKTLKILKWYSEEDQTHLIAYFKRREGSITNMEDEWVSYTYKQRNKKLKQWTDCDNLIYNSLIKTESRKG